MLRQSVSTSLQALIDASDLAGAALLVWRRGRVVDASTVGWRDIAANAPMERRTLFRIASMTKPITSMAALRLMERGRFALTDPIANWAPEFAEMRVLRALGAPFNETEKAHRQITFDDLLTHRSGLTYGAFESGPLAQAYLALGGEIDSVLSPDEWIGSLAKLPLIHQPGAAFHYGCSTDLLGFLISRMEGASLGDLLQHLVFSPLGMKDTHFTVPADKRQRRAEQYGFDTSGLLTALRTAPGGATVSERPESMSYESGGQGLWSTVDDYLAFARTFIGQGEVDGVRILRPETLAMMTTNRLTEPQRISASMFGMPVFGGGHGFGLGVAVVMDADRASVFRGRGAAGTVSWPGAYGGWWQADPSDKSVMVLLSHNMLGLEQLNSGVGLGLFGAIADFHAAATYNAGAAT